MLRPTEPQLWLILVLAVFVGCNREPNRIEIRVERQDVRLLDVRLALRKGSHPGVRADDASKNALLGDTIWVYAVVRLTVGNRPELETVYFAHTQDIGPVGRDGDSAQPGWQLGRRVQVWNRLKQDIELKWYEVRPVKSYYRAGEPVEFWRAPLGWTGWYQELVGPVGFRRLIIEARYGSQIVTSGSTATEEAVLKIPYVCFAPDSTFLGQIMPFVDNLPYRPGSRLSSTLQGISYDTPLLIAAGLRSLGYRFPDGSTSLQFDSLAKVTFQGYIRFGRLYDTAGRPVALQPGRDLHSGDVILLPASRTCLVVASDSARSGTKPLGLPLGLRVITLGNSFARIQPLWLGISLWRRLLNKTRMQVLHFDPAPVMPAVKPKAGARTVRPSPARKTPKVITKEPAAKGKAQKPPGAKPKR